MYMSRFLAGSQRSPASGGPFQLAGCRLWLTRLLAVRTRVGERSTGIHRTTGDGASGVGVFPPFWWLWHLRCPKRLKHFLPPIPGHYLRSEKHPFPPKIISFASILLTIARIYRTFVCKARHTFLPQTKQPPAICFAGRKYRKSRTKNSKLGWWRPHTKWRGAAVSGRNAESALREEGQLSARADLIAIDCTGCCDFEG